MHGLFCWSILDDKEDKGKLILPYTTTRLKSVQLPIIHFVRISSRNRKDTNTYSYNKEGNVKIQDEFAFGNYKAIKYDHCEINAHYTYYRTSRSVIMSIMYYDEVCTVGYM